MHLQDPREIPAADVDELAQRAGACPVYRPSPWHSVPMLQRIEGKKGYLTSLTLAAAKLYELLRQDQAVQDHIQANKTVVLGGHEKIKLRAFTDRTRPNALLAIQHILHSCAFIAASPLVLKDNKPVRRDFIGVPMNRNEFVQGRSYGHLNYEAFTGMIYAMTIAMPPSNRPPETQRPWLEYIHPKISATDGRRTRIGAEPDFRTWMLHAGLIFPSHPHALQRRQPKSKTSLLWVRNRLDQDAPDAEGVRRSLARPLQGDELILPAINAGLSGLPVTCRLPDYQAYERHYDFQAGRSKLRLSGNTQLYRVFSYRDGWGGRLYGHWVQGVPSSLRRYLTINGNPVTELDYASMQLVLLYAIQGITVPEGDLYEFPGVSRDIMKLVLTVSVGAKNQADALNAIRVKLQDDNTTSHRTGDAERYYSVFWDRHSAVCPHKGEVNHAWAELQYADSQIALRVLRYLWEQDIPAIPIHDSFVVQEPHWEKLHAAMKAAWRDFWPCTDIRIKPSH